MNQPSASNMKRAGAMTFLLAIILATMSTFVFTAGAGGAGTNVPTLKMLDVCDKMDIPEWAHICWVMLKSASAPKTAEVTIYVLTTILS
jgi:hypothetical protein